VVQCNLKREGKVLETSKDLLNLAIAIVVVLCGGFLSYLLYHIAKVVQESGKSLQNINHNMEKFNPVVDEVIPTIREVNDTVRGANQSLANVGKIFQGISSWTSFMNKNKHNEEDENV
jgi:predicted PurR-regulated permease PerM